METLLFQVFIIIHGFMINGGWTQQQQQFSCPFRDEAFELVTGFVFTSPDSILDTLPGVLKLDECIEACRGNSTCLSVNYETGLCVLFSTSAEQTPGKHYCLLFKKFKAIQASFVPKNLRRAPINNARKVVKIPLFS